MQDAAPALLSDHTQTQKAEAGLGKHGAAHRQDGTDEHDFSQVGQNMPYHDIGAAGSHGALNLYKRQGLELLHPAADDAGRRGPGGDADGQDDVPHAGIQKGHQNDGQRQRGQRHGHVGHLHDDLVRPSA